MAEGTEPKPYVDGWQGPLINESITVSSNFDNTYSITYPTGITELLITLQNSNGRTLTSNVIPYNQFRGGAIYLGFSYYLTSSAINNYVNFVVIDVNGTQIEFAGNGWSEVGSVRLRIYWK